MAEIVNLRQARKRAARRDDEAKAADNRTAFGLPKAEKRKAAIERARADSALDGRRLSSSDRDTAGGTAGPADGENTGSSR